MAQQLHAQSRRLLQSLKALGTTGYFIGIRCRCLDPLIKRWHGPPGWIQYYKDNSFYLQDPRLQYAYRNEGVRHWEELAGEEKYDVLEAAHAFGMKRGLVVATGTPHSKSLAILSHGETPHSERDLAIAQKILIRLHNLHRSSNVSLTPREREALQLMAQGRNYVDAGEQIGISVSGVKARLSNARRKLGAKTTIEAIQRAYQHRIL